MKHKLHTATNHDIVSILGYDCGVCFFNTLKAIIVIKRHRPKQLAPIKVWFVWRMYRLQRKFGNLGVEYKDLIDLMDRPINMENGLCWYLKELAISELMILRIIIW